MRLCKFFGTEMLEFDEYGNEIWRCPNDCASLKVSEQIAQEVAAKSDEQRQADDEKMLAAGGDEVYVRQTHCWHCLSVVTRTPETRDGPYGNFCPMCGESLRNHDYYGEGRPGDKARN